MDQLEDKALLLKQYLREMEDELRQKKAQLARMEQTGRDLDHALAGRRQSLEQLETDLDLAVTREKDDIARMLIRKRRTLEAGCVRLQGRLERLREEQDGLVEVFENQTLQFEQLKVKAAAFQQTEENRRETPDVFDQAPHQWATPTEEEVELELLQRKEALQTGGGS
jgi:phage shock protein A